MADAHDGNSWLERMARMRSNELQQHVLGAYFSLRAGIVVLSLAFPLTLYFGGRWWDGIPLQTSMSAYYGAHDGFMRNWFVGILWVVGWFLYAYKGFSTLENIVLNIAGVFGVLIAMVPCRCWDADPESSKVHGFVAVSFFVLMAFVCIRCGPDTIELLPDKQQQARFRRYYNIIGAAMVLSPAAALLVSYVVRQLVNYKFFVEMFGIYAFATYWLVKSWELSITSAEKTAAQGRAENVPGRGVVCLDDVQPQR